jgi:AraC-like DNA-binding protein
MYRFLLFMIAFLFGSSLLFSQKGDETNGLIQKAKAELFVNPEQGLKITQYILHNYNSNSAVVQSNSLLANYYFITGKYTLAVDNIMLAVKGLPQIDDKEIQIETLLNAAGIFNFLDLYEASREYLDLAKTIAEGNDKLEKKLKTYELLYSKSGPGITIYKRILKETSPEEIGDYASLTKGKITTQIAEKFLDQEMADSAAVYFFTDITKIPKKAVGDYWEMIAQLHLSDYYFKKKDYREAAKILTSCLEKASLFKSSYFQAAIYERLARNYLVLKNKEQYREFSQKASAAANGLNIEKTLAVNTAFDKLQNQKLENINAQQESENNILMVLGIAVLIMALIWLFARWQYKTRIRYTSNSINYLKLIKNSGRKPEKPEKLVLKNPRPKETDELLLSKLTDFENGNKYLSKDISLAQLAAQLGTNTKYLSEVINQYKEKNFNAYINELRIHYIVNKLKTDPIYLSSEL